MFFPTNILLHEATRLHTVLKKGVYLVLCDEFNSHAFVSLYLQSLEILTANFNGMAPTFIWKYGGLVCHMSLFKQDISTRLAVFQHVS